MLISIVYIYDDKKVRLITLFFFWPSRIQKSTVTWSDWDERELQKETALVRAGVLFLRHKDC